MTATAMAAPLGFWLAALVLGLVVGFFLVRPLWRPARPTAGRSQGALAIYRDQLAELEREKARGVIGAAEAEAAALEIKRRALAAEDKEEGAASSAGGKAPRWLALALAGAIPLVALGLYAQLGNPGLPDNPLAERPLVERDPEAAIAQLARRLQANPGDPRGWRILASAYSNRDHFEEAAVAWRHAIAAAEADPNQEPESSDYSALGEMLVAGANGAVGPEARNAFAQALRRDPNDARARFYGGLAQVQDGALPLALETWRGLAADSPPDAPWMPVLDEQIAALEAEIANGGTATADAGSGAATGGSRPPALDAETLANAGQMSAGDQQTMIDSMVARLAARLEENPDDPQGWLRLARSYQVLGKAKEAAGALARAAPLVAALPAGDPLRGEFQALGGSLPAGGGETNGGGATSSGGTGGIRPPALDAETLANAGQMSAGDRQAMIESMVARLADRLEESPNDLEGWLRLARSYLVLGKAEDARGALGRAAPLLEPLAAGDPLRQQYQALESALPPAQ